MKNNNKILQKVKKLIEYYENGSIPQLKHHEVNPGLEKSSRENYLYFTLAPSINFQRSSPAMWRSALATYEDPQTNFVFFPELVISQTKEKMQEALTKHALALQKNKHVEIWMKISQTLHNHFEADPRNLIKQYGRDSARIVQMLQKERKVDFPYLSGPKLSNYWLLVLHKNTDVQLKNMQEISIIPDTHVIQSTIQLGLADKKLLPLEVEKIWKELLLGSSIYPVDVHSVLWNWSRNKFLPIV